MGVHIAPRTLENRVQVEKIVRVGVNFLTQHPQEAPLIAKTPAVLNGKASLAVFLGILMITAKSSLAIVLNYARLP